MMEFIKNEVVKKVMEYLGIAFVSVFILKIFEKILDIMNEAKPAEKKTAVDLFKSATRRAKRGEGFDNVEGVATDAIVKYKIELAKKIKDKEKEVENNKPAEPKAEEVKAEPKAEEVKAEPKAEEVKAEEKKTEEKKDNKK